MSDHKKTFSFSSSHRILVTWSLLLECEQSASVAWLMVDRLFGTTDFKNRFYHNFVVACTYVHANRKQKLIAKSWHTHARTHNKMTISCFRTCITQIEDDYDFEINGERSVKIAIIVQAKWHMHRTHIMRTMHSNRSPWLLHVHVDSDENNWKIVCKIFD